MPKERIPFTYTLELTDSFSHKDSLHKVLFAAYRAALKMDENIEVWVHEIETPERFKVGTMSPEGRVEPAYLLDEVFERSIEEWHGLLEHTGQ